MSTQFSPTVRPCTNFNVEKDCGDLHSAMKGLGTDEQKIIDIWAYRSCGQRQEIQKKYKTMYGRDLVDHFKAEVSGKFEKVVVALSYTRPTFAAQELRRAMKGAGTDEQTLIEILCSASNDEIEHYKKEYKSIHDGHELEEDIMSETSGDFKCLLVSLLQANRDANYKPQKDEILNDVNQLYEAGEAKWGTDESVFNRILASKSIAHLREVIHYYPKKSGKELEDAVASEMSGNTRDAYIAIIKCVKDMPDYFAGKLNKSIKGLGTDDEALIRIVVSRCEIDMGEIKARYHRNYGQSLEEAIANDISGDYKKIILALVS